MTKMYRKADLVKAGVEVLMRAERSVTAMQYEEAAVQADIANAYARLADALDERAISV